MATTTETATLVTALAGGQYPEWYVGRLSSLLVDPPEAARDGFNCHDVVVGYLNVACREIPAARSIYAAPNVVDAATTYKLWIPSGGATSSDVEANLGSGLATAEAIVDAAVTAIGLAAAGVPEPLEAEKVEVNDTFDRPHTMAVRVRGARALRLEATSGTGTWAVEAADAEGAYVQLWAVMTTQTGGNVAPPAWVRFGAPIHVGPQGASERLTLTGVDRLYPQVIASGNGLDGAGQFAPSALVTFGPATIGS